MTRIELTPREAEVLRKVLEGYLSELRTEIAHTDSMTYREGLVARQEVLLSVAEQLEEEVGASAG